MFSIDADRFHKTGLAVAGLTSLFGYYQEASWLQMSRINRNVVLDYIVHCQILSKGSQPLRHGPNGVSFLDFVKATYTAKINVAGDDSAMKMRLR